MSVRKGERTEGNLQVLNLSMNLAKYTLQICSNEKVFPKKQRWVTTQKLVNECIDAVSCIRRANSVFVKTTEDYLYRRSQQIEARAHLSALLTLIDLSYQAFSIESHRIEYWTGLVYDTEEKLRAWTNSDWTRFGKYIEPVQ